MMHAFETASRHVGLLTLVLVFGAIAAAAQERGAEAPAPAAATKDDGGFRKLAVLDVGQNPQQIAFAPDGKTAYVAAARSNRVFILDARAFLVIRSVLTPGIPLGVKSVPPGGDLAVSLFREGRVQLFPLDGRPPGARLPTGKGPSMLVGPLPDGTYLISAERSNVMHVFRGEDLSPVAEYPTGEQPFPPSATSDGKLAFVPNFVGGSVSVVDLAGKKVLGEFPVGKGPSGGAVLPGDRRYAVVLRQENRVAVLDTRTRTEVQSVAEGIGWSPLSMVVSPDGRLAFVNNTESHDISVIELPGLEVIARVPVEEIPASMAVHPSGENLWVSCEGTHRVVVVEIPERWRGPAPTSSGD
jgi:YVTN family beta-propeller protein